MLEFYVVEVKSEEVVVFYVGEAEVWLGVYVGYCKGGYSGIAAIKLEVLVLSKRLRGYIVG